MHLEKQQLIEVIKNALKQQHDGTGYQSTYVYADEEDMISIDGNVDIGQLADTIIEADIAEYRKPLR